MESDFFKVPTSEVSDLYISAGNIACFQDKGDVITIILHKGVHGTTEEGHQAGGDTVTLQEDYAQDFRDWVDSRS